MTAGVEARRGSACCSSLVPPGQGTCSHPVVQLERSGWARKAGILLGGSLPIGDAEGRPTTLKSAPLRVPHRGLGICTQPCAAKRLSRGTCCLQSWHMPNCLPPSLNLPVCIWEQKLLVPSWVSPARSVLPPLVFHCG